MSPVSSISASSGVRTPHDVSLHSATPHHVQPALLEENSGVSPHHAQLGFLEENTGISFLNMESEEHHSVTPHHAQPALLEEKIAFSLFNVESDEQPCNLGLPKSACFRLLSIATDNVIPPHDLDKVKVFTFKVKLAIHTS